MIPGPKAKHTQAHVWRRIAQSITNKFSVVLEHKQCKDKWNTMKQRYLLHKFKIRSGSPEQMEEILLAFPHFEKFDKILGSSDLTQPAIEITSVLPGTDVEVVQSDGSIVLKSQVRILVQKIVV